ncbi:hypothetical protein SHIRM173S_07125 [Streptomyces hirsutus]
MPERARADAQDRRGFRIGCTADGPEGPVRLEVAVQAEPGLRIVGERLTADGVVLLETALRDPRRRTVQAAWHTAGATPVTRGPLPDDRLGTALLPLRVAGRTPGERRVLAAAEQMVVALRSVFACDPRPDGMRDPVPSGTGRLLGDCGNLADVLWRTHAECAIRYGLLVSAVRAGCAGPVAGLLAEPYGGGLVRALLDRGDGIRTELGRLGDGKLRYVALALVLHRTRCTGGRRAGRGPGRAADPHRARRRARPGHGPAPARGNAAAGGADVRTRAHPAGRLGERRLLGRGGGRRDGGTPGP